MITLNVLIPDSTGTPTNYSARIVMPDTELSTSQNTFEKIHKVGRTSGINSVTSNTITFDSPHNLLSGESIRVIAENGHLPDGLESNTIYFAITSGVGTDQIKVAKTLNDSINGDSLTINNKGGILRVQSRVSDKNAGDIGHPIQLTLQNLSGMSLLVLHQQIMTFILPWFHLEPHLLVLLLLEHSLIVNLTPEMSLIRFTEHVM